MDTRILLCLALALGAAGCGSGTPSEMTEEYALPVAEELIKPLLRDPDSAVFSGIIFHAETATTSAIVCGYVNSKNGFGGMTGPQRFITGGTIILEEQVGKANMDVAWSRFC